MPINILIVDDSAAMRGFIRKTLGATQLPLGEVWEAANGRQGLDKMQTDWVDLVLADLNMPDMTGVEMIDRMSQIPLLSAIPVVVVSSEGDKTVLDSLARKGVREFVRKPFQAALFQEVVERVLSNA